MSYFSRLEQRTGLFSFGSENSRIPDNPGSVFLYATAKCHKISKLVDFVINRIPNKSVASCTEDLNGINFIFFHNLISRIVTDYWDAFSTMNTILCDIMPTKIVNRLD